jgi:hypothetical protein
MNETLSIKHTCGCWKTYEVEVPAAMLERMREQLQAEPCRAADCPARGRSEEAGR